MSTTTTTQDYAPRTEIAFFCASGHEFTKVFAADISTPSSWECPHCGCLGTQRSQSIKQASVATRKTHWDMVQERRDFEELSLMLIERVDQLRQDR